MRPRHELGNDAPLQLIRHVPQEVTNGDGRLTGFPLVDHTFRGIITHLLLKGVEGLVQLEPGVARGEGCDKNIGLGPFGGVVIDAGVNSF